MSMINRFRSRARSSARRTSTELTRALRSAPTPASRDEILQLQNR